MLDQNTLDKIKNIVFDNEAKAKDRLDGAKLLLSAGYMTNEICTLLHGFIDSPDYSNQVKVKSASLLHTYEVKPEKEEVKDDTDKIRQSLLDQYNVGFVDFH